MAAILNINLILQMDSRARAMILSAIDMPNAFSIESGCSFIANVWMVILAMGLCAQVSCDD